MNAATWQHLFGWRSAFDHPVSVWIVAGIALALLLAPFIIFGLFKFQRISPV